VKYRELVFNEKIEKLIREQGEKVSTI